MATRIFCDQCGNTISDNRPIVVLYGAFESMNFFQQGQLGANIAQGAHTQNRIPPPQLDLCKICYPIWMDRVKNLTKVSDVSTK
jgi:hypothetical protein